jgi:hypothetical protein
MKIIKKQFKSTALFLSILLLFQGCIVYHKGTRTLDQAVQEQKRVKITTLDNRTMAFKRIVINDGKYYGVKKLKNNTKDVWLFENDIKELKVENKTMSIVVSTFPLTIPLFFIGMGYLLGPKTFGFGFPY